jgi:hypothetical protein
VSVSIWKRAWDAEAPEEVTALVYSSVEEQRKRLPERYHIGMIDHDERRPAGG